MIGENMNSGMKKFCVIFLFTLCVAVLFTVSEAQACVAPIDTESATKLCYEKNVSMNSFYLEMRPTESNYFAVTMEFSLKNTSEEQINVNIGVPQYFYGSLTKISSFAVSRNGTLIKTKLTDMEKNEELSSSDPYYSTMYVWSATIEADEIAFFRSTFTVNTRLDKKNTEYVDIPLKALNFWGEGKTQFKAVLDSAMLNVYTYDKTPSIEPTTMDETGALVWNISDFAAKRNLSFYYNNDISVIAKYFTNTASDDIQKQAGDLFKARRYYEAINLINSNEELNNDVNYRFMKMVCCEKLGDTKSYVELLNELFNKDICFSANSEYDISEYVKKRMLYAYYNNAKNVGAGEEMLNEILEEGISTMTASSSTLFMNWVNGEKKRNLLVIGSDYKENNNSNNGSNNIQQSGELTAKDWFKQLSQPAVLTVGLVVVLVALFCVFGMFADKNNKGGKKNKKIRYTKR